MTRYDFVGKKVMITGAGGYLGRSVSEMFADAGAELIIIDKESEKLERLSVETRKKYNVKTISYVADLRNVREIENLGDKVKRGVGKVDILVNCIGINNLKTALDFLEEDWDKVLDTNLKSVFFISKTIGDMMISERAGTIVNISSQHGIVGNFDRSAYCASKAGVINLTRALACEWAPYGIRVNCVSPTYIVNSENESLLLTPNGKRQYLKTIPLGRYCYPKDVSSAVLFLSSDGASMITGHNLVVDGGYTVV
ncbi:MAG: SDR family oxidoreductase [Parasporobacterium sp.]|nr:SDR family oxidoreductase [Parasporobacterium sp.]